MSCNRYKKFMVPFAEGTLPERLMEEVDNHISSCNACSRELDELVQTMNILCSTDYPAMEPAYDLRSRVMAQIADAPVRKPWWTGKLQAYSAVAAALVFLGITVAAIGPFFDNNSMHMEEALMSKAVGTSGSAPPQSLPDKSMVKGMVVPGGTAPASTSSDTISTVPVPAPQASGGMASKLTGKPSNTRSVPKKEPGTLSAERLHPLTASSPRMAKAGSPSMAEKSIGDQYMEMDNGYQKMSESAGMPPSAGARGPQGPAGPPSVDQKMVFNQMSPGGSPDQTNAQLDSANVREPSVAAENRIGAASGFGDASVSKSTSMDQKDEEESTLSLERKLVNFPNSIALMTKLLDAYKRDGRAHDEYAIAERLTKADPDNPKYWFARAQAAERAKMQKTAVSCYKTAIDRKLAGPELELAKSRLKALGD